MSETTVLDPETTVPDVGQPPTSPAPPETQVAEPQVFETREEFVKSLETEGGKDETQAKAPVPVARRSLLDDPKAKTYRENHNNRYNQRQAEIETTVGFDELVGYGVPPEAAQATATKIRGAIKRILNDEHSDGIQFGGYGAAAEAVDQVLAGVTDGMVQGFEEGVHKDVTAAIQQMFDADNAAPWPKVFSAIQEAARKGHVPTKGLKAAEVAIIQKVGLEEYLNQTFNRGRDQREHVGNGAESKPNGVQSAVLTNNITYAQAMKMSPKQIEAIPTDVWEKIVSGG